MVRRAPAWIAVIAVGVVIAMPSSAGASVQPREADGNAVGVKCRGGSATCKARVSLAGGASDRRLVIRLGDRGLRLVSVRPNRRSLRGAYNLSGGHLSADGSRYVVVLNAVRAIRRGSLIFTFRARRRLAWRACPDARGAQCATLRVPVSWERPRAAQVSLALVRRRATDRDRRVGSLLFNCGGPGCPSAQLVKLAPEAFTERVRRRFDIVGFDPRGIGESTPVRCGLPAFDPSIPVFPATVVDYRRLVDRNRALARSCRRRTGPLLMHVGAPDTIRDMEAIRAALRDGKLNWLGLSYGTLLGAEYAERYPRRIRTMVLDGALDRALSEPIMLGAEARTAEDVFNRWAEWCNATAECPLNGQDPASVFDRLVAAANRSPIPASSVGRGVSGEEIQNNADSYLLFTRPTAVFGQASWLTLGPAIVKALGGDASEFATGVAGPPDDPLYAEQAIECLDFPAQSRSFADLAARAAFARIVAPHLGGGVQTARVLSKCIGWPRPRRDPRHFLDIDGAPPALIVNATHDPSTSYAWALSMQAQFPRSVLLTRDGNGHTSYLTSPCAQTAIDRYLIDRDLPRQGTVCVDESAVPSRGR